MISFNKNIKFKLQIKENLSLLWHYLRILIEVRFFFHISSHDMFVLKLQKYTKISIRNNDCVKQAIYDKDLSNQILKKII